MTTVFTDSKGKKLLLARYPAFHKSSPLILTATLDNIICCFVINLQKNTEVSTTKPHFTDEETEMNK